MTICNKYLSIVQSFGMTQDPSNDDYMFIMDQMDINLRKYLQQNHNQIIWKEKIHIVRNIITSLERIHFEKAIHGDLHSGNILYDEAINGFCISDLGTCGPVNKSSKGIYGNLPYKALEVIVGKEYTVLLNLIFIVLAYLCRKFHQNNHHLSIMNVIIILQ